MVHERALNVIQIVGTISSDRLDYGNDTWIQINDLYRNLRPKIAIFIRTLGDFGGLLLRMVFSHDACNV